MKSTILLPFFSFFIENLEIFYIQFLITLANTKPGPIKIDDFDDFINNFDTWNFNLKSFGN